MRKVIKTVSSKAEKFIPKSQRDDASLSEDAKEVADRPMYFMRRKMSREDRYNIGCIMDTKTRQGETSVINLGTVAKYIWENCVFSVHNVLLESGAVDVVKGEDKNALFNAEGMEEDIAEVIRDIQQASVFSEAEAKN